MGEVGNIGSAHVANKLSEITNERVDIETPEVEMLDINEFIKYNANITGKLFLCWSKVTLIINAVILTIFQLKDIVYLLFKDKKYDKSLKFANSFESLPDSLKNSLLETGIHIGEAYTNSISDLIGKEIHPDSNNVLVTSPLKLIDILESNLNLDEDLSLIITTKLKIKKYNIESTISFIPDHKKIKDLLKILSEITN